VFCRDDDQNVVADTFCADKTKPPVMVQGCNPEPCEFANWMTTLWGTCENGKKIRTRHCHASDGSNAEDAECNASIEPVLEKTCAPGVCDPVVPQIINGGPGGTNPAPSPTPASPTPALSAASSIAVSPLLAAAAVVVAILR
jgi:hypothetical protein